MPPVYETLDTRIELVNTRPSGEEARVPLAAPGWRARVPGTVASAAADVTFSGRLHLTVPILAPRP
jgi:hypothetical protein